MIYQLKGMACNLLVLPAQILTLCMEFFEIKDQFKYSLVCSRFRKCVKEPYLRKEIRINNNMLIFNQQAHQKVNFRNILQISNQLRVLSLKYCPNFNKEFLQIINLNCNPFTLQELYLDGCDLLSDDAFDCLMQSEAEMITNEDIAEEKSPGDVEKLMESLLSKDQDSMIVNIPPDLGRSEDQINF